MMDPLSIQPAEVLAQMVTDLAALHEQAVAYHHLLDGLCDQSKHHTQFWCEGLESVIPLCFQMGPWNSQNTTISGSKDPVGE